MQHTSNYNLPQWEASDPIKRADFNGAMSAIDTAVKAASDAAGAAQSTANSAPKMTIGTYTGTGTYGSANKNTLTFPFPPKLVLIRSITGGSYGGTFIYPQTISSMENCGTSNHMRFAVTWSGNSVTWANDREDFQLNTNGATYYYAAFG